MINLPYFVKREQPAKYQFYTRSKKVAQFYLRQMLSEVRYPPPMLDILEYAVVIFLHIIVDD
jgi:hypothetical protein